MYIVYWLLITGVAVAVLLLLRFRSPKHQWSAAAKRAGAAFDRRDWLDAERHCRVCLSIAMMLEEPARAMYEGHSLMQLAHALYRLGRMREAESTLRQALPRLRASFTGGHPGISAGHALWGDLCMDQGRYPEAEQQYERAVAADEQIGNIGMMIFALQRLGEVLIQQARWNDAEEVIDRCVKLEVQVLRDELRRTGEQPDGSQILSMSLPDLYFSQRRFEDATRVYQQKVDYWEHTHVRPDSIDLGRLQTRLGIAQAMTGHYEGSVEMLRRAAETYRREWSADHPRVAVSLARLAVVLERAHRGDEARAAAQGARELLAAKGLEEHPEFQRLAGLVS
ncbi:MAG: tetratricopeptide repeat protein [Bryobacterales bacterium]|nr:tetratricopeptide repeat protein [Bryobacterales bacterium]